MGNQSGRENAYFMAEKPIFNQLYSRKEEKGDL
jgi:hypothetical protein